MGMIRQKLNDDPGRMHMIIKKLVVGPLENNCFIIADEKTKECMVIDPG